MIYLLELSKKNRSVLRKKLRVIATVLMVTPLLFGFSGKASALCALCDVSVQLADSFIWQQAEDNFDADLNNSFKKLEKLIVHDLWEQSVLPAMMLAAEQLTAVAMQQVMTIGMFIDAESQLNAQRLLQEIRAKAHKDYHPSIGMCEFGSLMKSIAASERRGEVMAVVLSQRSQDRQLGQRDTSGTYGNDLDQLSRINHFKGLFCNINDRGNVLIHTTAFLSLCDTKMVWDNSFTKDARERMNKDIDYFSLVDSPWTLSIDFTNKQILDTSATPKIHDEDEEHILAMASNLYANKTFPRIPSRLLTNRPEEPLSEMQKAYLDMRAIIAKRSVAENSFYAISAMKAAGNKANSPSGGGGCTVAGGSTGNGCTGVNASGKPSSASNPVPGSIGGPNNARVYMEHILKELGVPSAEALKLLGDNPSYYSQMEILTKKLYQNPDFYTNLYDKPANVERKTVALQAINLMQKFDMLKSYLRGEVSTSILLELAVSDLQNEIEDQIQIIDVGN